MIEPSLFWEFSKSYRELSKFWSFIFLGMDFHQSLLPTVQNSISIASLSYECQAEVMLSTESLLIYERFT